MADRFHLGNLGLPELFLILVVALLGAGWRRLRR